MTDTTSTPADKPADDQPTADVLRELLKEARTEAAATRVKGKERVEAAKAEVTAEYEAKLAEAAKAGEAFKAELGQSKLQVSKLQAALDAVAPDVKERVVEIANRLVGSTDEELAADAAKVKGLLGVPETKTKATDPSQGQGNEALPLNGDPLMNAMMATLNKRKR